MGGSIYNIGVSGLKAAQIALTTTSHNITNVNTAGYHRQQAVSSANIPQYTGDGFVGQGVKTDDVTRIYNQYLDTQVLGAETLESYYSSYQSQISQIDNFITASGTSLTPMLQNFFSSLQTLSSHPEDASVRQSFLGTANALTSRFRLIDDRLTEIQDATNQQIESTVGQINAYAEQIAKMNEQIEQIKAGRSDMRPNDLIDQRGNLIAELNKLVKVTVVPTKGDMVNVYIGKGQSLVVDTSASKLSAGPSNDDPQRYDVYYDLAGNDVRILPDMLEGGALGGLLNFRDSALMTARNGVGRIAMTMSETFNAQHRLGQDINGDLGGDFFSYTGPQVLNNKLNTGSAALSASIANYSAVTTSDYTMTYTGSGWLVTRQSDNAATAYASLPAVIDGVSVNIASGAVAVGDTFTLKPTALAAGNLQVAIVDGGKIAAAAPMRTAAALSNQGDGKITAGEVIPPLNANVSVPITLQYNAGNLEIRDTASNALLSTVAYTSGMNVNYNGWRVQVSGNLQDGDRFTVSPNTSGVTDNRNVLKLVGLQTSNTLANGTANYQVAYGQVVNSIGNDTSQANINLKAQSTLATQAKSARDSFSGVNLDEEAANLIRFQQLYSASAKIMQTAQEMFSTLIQLGQ